MEIKNKLQIMKTSAYMGATTAAMALAHPSMAFAEGSGDFLGSITIGEDGTVQGVEDSNTIQQGNVVLEKLKDVLGVIQGIAIVLCIIFLIVAGAQLAMSSGNSQKRAQAYEAIKNCAIGAGITGAAAFIIQIAYSFLL